MIYDNQVQSYLAEIRKYKYDEKDNIEYLRRYYNGEKDLLEHIFKMNALLVVKCVNKFSTYINNSNLDIMDLIQYGNLSLIKAIEKFDISYSNTFSTFAGFVIENDIYYALVRYGYPVNYRIKGYYNIKKYKKVYDLLYKKLNREPNIQELANNLNTTEEKVLELQKFMLLQNITSLNSSVFDEENELIDIIEDKDSHIDFLEKLNHEETREYILELLKKINLTEKEYQVIILRFGLLDGRVRTLVEISEQLKCSKQRIFQLEKRSLNKIQKSKHIFELAMYTDTPMENLENIGYNKTKIKSNLEKLNKI